MAIDEPSVPIPLLGDGANAPPSRWITLLSPNEQAAYDTYLKAEARLAACIQEAAVDLHAYWHAQDAGTCDATVAAAGIRALATLDELYAQLRLVRSLRGAIEQEGLQRMARAQERRR